MNQAEQISHLNKRQMGGLSVSDLVLLTAIEKIKGGC